MPPDTTRARERAQRGMAVSRHQQVAPPLERAQLVWRRALAMGRGWARPDPFTDALDLLRTANHDPATLSHALAIGHTHLRLQPDDADAQAGAAILAAAIGFLGVKPRADEIAPQEHRYEQEHHHETGPSSSPRLIPASSTHPRRLYSNGRITAPLGGLSC